MSTTQKTKHTPYWLIEQVKHRQGKRDWSKLPASFEQQQVKGAANNVIEHLRVLDPIGTIKLRIEISKASRFDELIKALEKGYFDSVV